MASQEQERAAVEVEKRFRVTDEQFNHIAQLIKLTEFERVCDLTYGPSGAQSMQTDGWVLRIRTRSAGSTLEYKSPANAGWTMWNEISTSIGSARATANLLEAIGMKPGLILDRIRGETSYMDALISLDKFELLGSFVEIEVTTRGGLTQIDRIAAVLGLESEEPTRPYGELLLQKLTSDEKARELHGKAIEDFRTLV